MFAYYLKLALRSLRRNTVLTALIVMAIGLGIGASMTMITVLHVMSGDPLPGRSAKLYFPRLYPGPADASYDFGRMFTWPDASHLLDAQRGVRQAMMVAGRAAVVPGGDLKPFNSGGRYVSSQFFAMFGVPFATGQGWGAHADRDRAHVVVLNGGLARKLFGNAAGAIGQSVDLQGREFRVVGVLHDWHPQPLFYGGSSGTYAFDSNDQFFLPINTAMALKLPFGGGMSCFGHGDCGRNETSTHTTWLQFWVELDTPTQVAAYRSYLAHYWQQQKALGRFPKDKPPQLFNLMQRLDRLGMVPSNVKLQLWLALGFLGVCLFNTVGLMLAKFLRRGGEVSVRRALGATRRDVFTQLGIEAAILGLGGGLLGLLLTWAGLWLVRQRPEAYAKLAHLDPTMVLGVFVLAVITSILAGLLPAWRACRIPPALQLKVQ